MLTSGRSLAQGKSTKAILPIRRSFRTCRRISKDEPFGFAQKLREKNDSMITKAGLEGKKAMGEKRPPPRANWTETSSHVSERECSDDLEEKTKIEKEGGSQKMAKNMTKYHETLYKEEMKKGETKEEMSRPERLISTSHMTGIVQRAAYHLLYRPKGGGKKEEKPGIQIATMAPSHSLNSLACVVQSIVNSYHPDEIIHNDHAPLRNACLIVPTEAYKYQAMEMMKNALIPPHRSWILLTEDEFWSSVFPGYSNDMTPYIDATGSVVLAAGEASLKFSETALFPPPSPFSSNSSHPSSNDSSNDSSKPSSSSSSPRSAKDDPNHASISWLEALSLNSSSHNQRCQNMNRIHHYARYSVREILGAILRPGNEFDLKMRDSRLQHAVQAFKASHLTDLIPFNTSIDTLSLLATLHEIIGTIPGDSTLPDFTAALRTPIDPIPAHIDVEIKRRPKRYEWMPNMSFALDFLEYSNCQIPYLSLVRQKSKEIDHSKGNNDKNGEEGGSKNSSSNDAPKFSFIERHLDVLQKYSSDPGKAISLGLWESPRANVKLVKRALQNDPLNAFNASHKSAFWHAISKDSISSEFDNVIGPTPHIALEREALTDLVPLLLSTAHNALSSRDTSAIPLRILFHNNLELVSISNMLEMHGIPTISQNLFATAPVLMMCELFTILIELSKQSVLSSVKKREKEDESRRKKKMKQKPMGKNNAPLEPSTVSKSSEETVETSEKRPKKKESDPRSELHWVESDHGETNLAASFHSLLHAAYGFDSVTTRHVESRLMFQFIKYQDPMMSLLLGIATGAKYMALNPRQARKRSHRFSATEMLARERSKMLSQEFDASIELATEDAEMMISLLKSPNTPFRTKALATEVLRLQQLMAHRERGMRGGKKDATDTNFSKLLATSDTEATNEAISAPNDNDTSTTTEKENKVEGKRQSKGERHASKSAKKKQAPTASVGEQEVKSEGNDKESDQESLLDALYSAKNSKKVAEGAKHLYQDLAYLIGAMRTMPLSPSELIELFIARINHRAETGGNMTMEENERKSQSHSHTDITGQSHSHDITSQSESQIQSQSRSQSQSQSQIEGDPQSDSQSSPSSPSDTSTSPPPKKIHANLRPSSLDEEAVVLLRAFSASLKGISNQKDLSGQNTSSTAKETSETDLSEHYMSNAMKLQKVLQLVKRAYVEIPAASYELASKRAQRTPMRMYEDRVPFYYPVVLSLDNFAANSGDWAITLRVLSEQDSRAPQPTLWPPPPEFSSLMQIYGSKSRVGGLREGYVDEATIKKDYEVLKNRRNFANSLFYSMTTSKHASPSSSSPSVVNREYYTLQSLAEQLRSKIAMPKLRSLYLDSHVVNNPTDEQVDSYFELPEGVTPTTPSVSSVLAFTGSLNSISHLSSLESRSTQSSTIVIENTNETTSSVSTLTSNAQDSKPEFGNIGIDSSVLAESSSESNPLDSNTTESPKQSIDGENANESSPEVQFSTKKKLTLDYSHPVMDIPRESSTIPMSMLGPSFLFFGSHKPFGIGSSTIRVFRECQIMFALRYVWTVEPGKPASIHATAGMALHEAASKVHSQMIEKLAQVLKQSADNVPPKDTIATIDKVEESGEKAGEEKEGEGEKKPKKDDPADPAVPADPPSPPTQVALEVSEEEARSVHETLIEGAFKTSIMQAQGLTEEEATLLLSQPEYRRHIEKAKAQTLWQWEKEKTKQIEIGTKLKAKKEKLNREKLEKKKALAIAKAKLISENATKTQKDTNKIDKTTLKKEKEKEEDTQILNADSEIHGKSIEAKTDPSASNDVLETIEVEKKDEGDEIQITSSADAEKVALEESQDVIETLLRSKEISLEEIEAQEKEEVEMSEEEEEKNLAATLYSFSETDFSFNLPTGHVWKGAWDRVDIDPDSGAVEITEYKTSLKRNRLTGLFQLHAYALAYWKVHRVVPSKLVLASLSHHSKYEEYVPTKLDLIRTENLILTTLQRIADGIYAPTYKPYLCFSCQYSLQCPSSLAASPLFVSPPKKLKSPPSLLSPSPLPSDNLIHSPPVHIPPSSNDPHLDKAPPTKEKNPKPSSKHSHHHKKHKFPWQQRLNSNDATPPRFHLSDSPQHKKDSL